MNKKTILFATVLSLIGVTALLCIYLKNNRRLGNPGVRMVKQTVYDVKGNVVGDETVPLPNRVLDYQGSTNLPVTMEELGFLPKDTTYARKTYESSDRHGILINVVIMGVDSRSIHKPEICLPSQGWTINSSEQTFITVNRPHEYQLPVKKLVATKEVKLANGSTQTVRSVYAYWFVAENAVTADHFDRMWRMGKELLRTGTLQRWAYASAFSVCLPGQEDATFQRMQTFIAESVPEFQLTTTSNATSSLSPGKSGELIADSK